MKVGQLVTTGPGAEGIITKVKPGTIVINWTKYSSGDNITNEDPVSYSREDIDHSLASGFLSIIDIDDPNAVFLMRKRDVHS